MSNGNQDPTETQTQDTSGFDYSTATPIADGPSPAIEQPTETAAAAPPAISTDVPAGTPNVPEPTTSPLDNTRLTAQLTEDEGKSGRPYKDAVGKTTIGIGRNLDDNPLTQDEQDYLGLGRDFSQYPLSNREQQYLFQRDLKKTNDALTSQMPWAKRLDPARYGVLVNMAFNMGVAGLGEFKTFLNKVQAGKFGEAADDMMKTHWAEQVGGRARKLADQMRSGIWRGDPTPAAQAQPTQAAPDTGFDYSTAQDIDVTAPEGTTDQTGGGAPGGMPILGTGQSAQGGPVGIAGNVMRAAQAAGPLFTGAGRAALRTVGGLSEAATRLTMGGKVNPQEAAQLEELTRPRNKLEAAGATAEQLAEWIGGGEAFKAMGVGEQLLSVGKLAEYYEKASPFMRAAIEHTMNVLRGGAIGGAEAEVKGESPVAGAAAGAAGELAGPALEAAGAVAGKVAGKVTGPTADAVKALWKSATGRSIQEAFQNRLLQTATKIADEEGVQIARPEIRNTFESIADALEDKAKTFYKPMDDISGGKFTHYQDRIRELSHDYMVETDPTREGVLIRQLQEQMKFRDAILDKARAAGIDPATTEEADRLFMKSSAMRNLDSAIKSTTEERPTTVNPGTFAKKLQKIEDMRWHGMRESRLTQAAGQYKEELLKNAYDLRNQTRNYLIARKVAKWAAYVGGAHEIFRGFEATH